jgi:hypothetical protein
MTSYTVTASQSYRFPEAYSSLCHPYFQGTKSQHYRKTFQEEVDQFNLSDTEFKVCLKFPREDLQLVVGYMGLY